MKVSIHNADCLRILKGMPDCSVDSIVTDPPYGLSFMGKKWDYDVPPIEVWQECLRVLKPGGHLLAFAGTRTQHRMAVRIEDAGFEIRDMIAWVYGSGFPKSRDVSKDMDRIAGAEREVIGKIDAPGMARTNVEQGAQGRSVYTFDRLGGPVSDAARQWQGWGTALKPALEPITVARKPLIGTVAENVLQHGTGGLNVDGCRVGTDLPAPRNAPRKDIRGGKFHSGAEAEMVMGHYNPTQGRWPANLIHDGSEEVVGLFPETAPAKRAERGKGIDGPTFRHATGQESGIRGHNDNGGSAARFFYCAKSSKKDRNEGCDDLPSKEWRNDGAPVPQRAARPFLPSKNNHPTVKPTELMRYLCRLVTPPNGVVLDPFMGSGSTGKAAVLEGFSFIGIEMNAEYYAIARTRIKSAKGVK